MKDKILEISKQEIINKMGSFSIVCLDCWRFKRELSNINLSSESHYKFHIHCLGCGKDQNLVLLPATKKTYDKLDEYYKLFPNQQNNERQDTGN